MTSNHLLGKVVTKYNDDKKLIPVLPVFISRYIQREKSKNPKKVLKATIISDAILDSEITMKQLFKYLFDILGNKKLDIGMCVYDMDNNKYCANIIVKENTIKKNSKKNLKLSVTSDDDVKEILNGLTDGTITWDSMVNKLIDQYKKIDVRFRIWSYDGSMTPIYLDNIRRAKEE